MLTSSLLTDRMILYTDLLPTLSAEADVEVWATSAANRRFQSVWDRSEAMVKPFPSVRHYPEFPHNYLRRLNELTWDYRLRPVSRLSMMRHVRNRRWPLRLRALKAPAYLLASLRAERSLESRLERFLARYTRSQEAAARLRAEAPDLILTTNPFWFHEPAVVAEARKLGIPVIALIPSWDNLTTKSRMVFRYDGYLLWSEQGRRELLDFYPASAGISMRVVGAPQFDVFAHPAYRVSRETFCAQYGFDPRYPIIVYAVGSPNFLQEQHGALDLARRVARGDLGEVQMLVRPHPIHDKGQLQEQFKGLGPRMVIQGEADDSATSARSQAENQIVEWVNTFRHASVVVNLASTVTVDAALCDVPVVNLDYDPEPGQPNRLLVQDVNHLWTHFKPVAESGGVWLTRDADETARAVKTYLQHPELHREQRRWIVNHVCGFADGRCGWRMGRALLELLRQLTGSPA